MKKILTPDQEKFIESLVLSCGDALEKYGRRCLNYNSALYPLAEDVLQATFLKAIEHVDQIMKHENTIGWLKATYHHILQHELRDYRLHREILSAAPEEIKDVQKEKLKSAVLKWEASQPLEDVLEAVAMILLSDEQLIFTDYFLNDHSILETAEKMGVSTGSIRGKIRTIRKKLKKIIFTACCLTLFLDYIG